MTSLKSLLGSKVVARENAEHLGDVKGAVVDVHAGLVIAWQVGKGRRAMLVDQEHVTGIGDAIVIDAETSLREPGAGVEKQTVKGSGVLLGALILGDDGTERGTVEDVDIDTTTAKIGVVTTSDGHTVPPAALRGLGAYALVVAAD